MLLAPCNKEAAKRGFFVDPPGLELFSHNAYNQLITKNGYSMVPKNTPLCLHLLFQSYVFFSLSILSLSYILKCAEIDLD
jgi:hypothetical protein